MTDNVSSGNVPLLKEISDTFESTLSSEHLTNRIFAGTSTHELVPNPLLVIEDGREIGIPLNKSHPDDIGIYGEDRWVAGNSVQIGNPAWSEWAEDNGKYLVERDLGVNKRCVQLKLKGLILAKSSEGMKKLFDLHSGSEKRETAMGTFLVMLPSFEPYTLHLDHPRDKGERLSITADDKQLSARTSMAAFYSGTQTTFELPNQDVTRWACLVYAIDYTFEGRKAPKIPETTASVVGKLKDVVSRWVNAKDPESLYLAWPLEVYYTDLQEIECVDKVAVKALKRLAEDQGLRMHLAKMKFERTGVDLDCDDYDEDMFDVAEEDAIDMVISEIEEEHVYLTKWIDWPSQKQLPKRFKPSMHPNDMANVVLPLGFWKNLGIPDSGSCRGCRVTHSWTWTTVFLWSEKNHARVLADLFGDDAIAFLDPCQWPDTEEGKASRIEFAEFFIGKLKSSEQPYSAVFQPPFYEPTVLGPFASKKDILLKFSVENRRPDLFLEVVKVFGMPAAGETNVNPINCKTVLSALGLQGEAVDKFVLECANTGTTPLGKIRIILNLFDGDVSRSKTLIEIILEDQNILRSFPKSVIPSIFTALGPEVFYDCILPRIHNFSNTQYWCDMIRAVPAPDKEKITQTYIAAVADAHIPTKNSFHINSLTTELFKICIETRNFDPAAIVLDKLRSYSAKLRIRNADERRTQYLGYITEVLSILQFNGVSPSQHPSFGSFLRYILLTQVLPALGPRPVQPTHISYVLKRVPCHCEVCFQVNEFLTSSQLETTIRHTTVAKRAHIRDQLHFWDSKKNDRINPRISVEEVTKAKNILLKKINMGYDYTLRMWDEARMDVERAVKELEKADVLGECGAIVNAAVRAGGLGWDQRAEALGMARTVQANGSGAAPSSSTPATENSTLPARAGIPISSLDNTEGSKRKEPDTENPEVAAKRKKPARVIDLTDENE